MSEYRHLKFKDYKFYKFPIYVSKELENNKPLFYKKCDEYSAFLRKFVDAFAPLIYSEIEEKHTLWGKQNNLNNKSEWLYKGKDWFLDAKDIAYDMLYNYHDIIHDRQYDSEYFYVPINRPDILKFIENNKPEWAITLKQHVFPAYTLRHPTDLQIDLEN